MINNFSYGAEPIVEALCRDGDSFRACYQMSYEQCLSRAEEAYRASIHGMPKTPTSPEPLGYWNILLGHHTEVAFETLNEDQFKSSEMCDKLLRNRKEHRRLKRSELEKMIKSKPEIPWYYGLGMLGLPFLSGVFLSIFYLRRKARLGSFKISHGLISWICFIFGSLVGEFASHMLLPFLYRGIGDNPAQVGALMAVWFVSPIINFGIWFYFKKNIVKETAS